MVRPKSTPKPGAKQNSKSILGKRKTHTESKATISSNARQNGNNQDSFRASKRARKTNMPYQAPESITSILRAVSKLEEADKQAKIIAISTPVKRSKPASSTPKSPSPRKQLPITNKAKTIIGKRIVKSVKNKPQKTLATKKSSKTVSPKLIKTGKKSDTKTKKLVPKLKKASAKLNSSVPNVNGAIRKKLVKAVKVNKTKGKSKPDVLDAQPAKPEKSPKKRKSTKGALNPKPNVTKYDTDPTFFSNLPIPHISTLAHSRLLIRAVLQKDMKQFKQLLTKDASQIASASIPRSPHVDRDVLSYILQLGNKEAMKILLDVDSKAAEKFGQFPDLMLEGSTGRGSRMMFGHALKGVTVGRGGKEGNAAFLIDSSHYQRPKIPLHYDQRDFYKNAIMVGASMASLEYHVEITSKQNSYAINNLLSNIVHAVRYGNYEMAGKLVNMAIKRGGHGFNQLHEEALVLDKNKPFSPFKSVSVIKKCTENCRITPIHCAAINPNPYYLQTLLSSNQEYNLLDTGNWTPVHYASVCSGDGPLKLLLSKGVPTLVIDKEANSPLHLAVSRGRLHNVKLLLANEQSNLDTNDDEGPTPTSSSNITKVNKAGQTPLLIACSEGHVEIVKALLDAGADGNKSASANFDKVSPLMVACRNGHLGVVKLLIERGVKVELGDRRGRTAIAYAVINGNADIVSYLLRLGVNHETKDSSGNNLVHYAAAYGWYFNMKLLLEAGCDPNQGNLWRMTPLALAFMKGHIGIVEMLVKQPGVDIDTPIDDSSGLSLLLKTCESSKLSANLIERLTFLIDLQKADCRKVDFEGNNGLHYLAQHRLSEASEIFKENLKYLLEAAKLLIDRGCDAGALNGKNVSPLSLAISCGNFWLAEKLVQWGQKISTDVNEEGNTILHEIVKHATSLVQSKWLYEKLAKDQETLSALKGMANIYNKAGYTALLQVLNSFRSVSVESAKYLNLLVTFLIRKLDSDVNATIKGKDDHSDSVLHLAVSTSYADTIIPILLAKKVDLDPLNKDQKTPLAIAVLNGLTNPAKALINARANVNFKLKNESSTTPIGLLLVLGKSQPNLFSLIPLFVSKGADVSEVTPDSQNSILHFVSKNPSQVHAFDATQSIIKAGADVNLKNSDQRTPLHLAVNARGKETDATYDVEDALISAGANVSIKDKRGRTVLHYAFVKIGKALETSFFDPIELVMLIVNAMKESKSVEAIRAKDIYGQTALHQAAMRGSTICCSYLVTEMRGNIDVTDNIGNTPFGLSVYSGHEGCSLYFQQQGADFSKILDTNIQIQGEYPKGQDPSCTSWTWSHDKLQKAEVEKKKLQDKKYPIFQEVVNKDWQGILHLMLGSLKSSGSTVSVGVAAAIKTQRLKLALKLIHCVKHPKELEQQKETLLHTLAKHSKQDVRNEDQSNSQIAVLNALIKKGVNPQQLDDYRTNPSIYAAIHLNYPMMLELSYALDNANYLNVVSKTPPDSYGRTPFTALFWSLGESTEFSKEIKTWAASLLSHGGSANITSQYPFILSPYPGTRCFVKLCDKEMRNLPKFSPLITAVIHGNLGVAKWLLSLGSSKVDPNFGDEQGRTPLMHAARLNDIKMVKLILSPDSYNYEKDKSPWRGKYSSWTRGKGGSEVDINARDRIGFTAVDHLIIPALRQKDYAFKNVEPILTILFKAGASFTAKSADNLSPLERAILHKRQHIVSLIYKLLKTPATQQIIIQPEYEGLSKLENEPGLSPEQPTFVEDARKAAEIKNKETEDHNGPQGPQPDPLLGMDKDNSEVVMDQDQNIPCDCIMTKVDISYGIYGLYNFYKMQVVKQPKGKELVFLFTQWGRVGDPGQHQKTPFATVDEAVKEFKKIFKTKSGNGWEQFNNFTPISKRYRLVNKELTKAKKAHELTVKFDHLLLAAKSNRSVLKQEVYEAIKKMSLAHKLNIDPHSNRFYSNRMSFEKTENLPIVTTEALKRGEDILKEIASALHKKDLLNSAVPGDNTEAVRTELVEKMVALSEEFYALVPVYGFATEKLQPVFDWHALRERQETIHNLIHLGFAKELLLAAEFNSTFTNPFEYVYRCLGTKIKLLDLSKEAENDEAQIIFQYIHNTKNEGVKIQGIYRIQVRDEQELSLDNRWLLWHGTKAENLLSILHNGLQVAPLGVNLSGHLFGKGIYLADMFAKSQKYCQTSGGCDSKFMLLCEAALGKIHEVNLAVAEEAAEKSGQFLPSGFNSLKTSDSLYEPDPRVSVVWKGRTVSLGTKTEIEYKEDESWGLSYNEFIVFDQNQVKLRYLIQFA